MEGWGWQSVHDPDILPTVLTHWKHSLQTGTAFEMTFPLKGDGVFRPFLTCVVPVHNEDGTIIHWFGTTTDIARQVELERPKEAFLGIASHELRRRSRPSRPTRRPWIARAMRPSRRAGSWSRWSGWNG